MFRMKIRWLQLLIEWIPKEVLQATTYMSENLNEAGEGRSKKDLTKYSQKMFTPNGFACRIVLGGMVQRHNGAGEGQPSMRRGDLFAVERRGGGAEDVFRNKCAWPKRATSLIPHHSDVAVRFAHSLC